MNISNIDHIGIRITEKNAALDFYKILGFQLEQEVDFDAVIIMKNKSGVEINLINNGNSQNTWYRTRKGKYSAR